MKQWVIAGAAVLVIVILGYVVINKYGQSRQDVGYASCQSDQATASLIATKTETKELEKIDRETQTMSDPAVIDDLRKLGILRGSSDR